ncbi:hypothetical protein LCGC14_3082670, partial [marine sediment metagenome]
TYYIYSVNSEDAENSSYITDSGSTNPIPAAPTIGSATVLSSTSIRWSFTDNADNETGFKIHDASHNTVATVSTAGASSITETGLTANTQYIRHVHAFNGAGDSAASTSVSKYTLAASPSVTPSKDTTSWYNNTIITFTSNVSLGVGGVSYYRYAFTEAATGVITNFNTLWNSGTLSIPISTSGIYYLHIKGYNAENVATSQASYGPFHFDLEKPIVKITSHTSGDYVKGEITLEADISDNVGVTDVGFYDNSLSSRISTTRKASFDTRKVEDGKRKIYAQVSDAAGSTSANIITLNVDNVKPSAPVPANPDKAKDKDTSKGAIEEVKKGQTVKVYFQIKEKTADNRSS